MHQPPQTRIVSDLQALMALLTSYEEVRVRLRQEGAVNEDDSKDHDLRLRLLESRILEKLVRWTGLTFH